MFKGGPCRLDLFASHTHSTVVALPCGYFFCLLSLKTMKNTLEQIQELCVYASNKSTLYYGITCPSLAKGEPLRTLFMWHPPEKSYLQITLSC